ncbi:MAG: hypothetical protein IT538_08415 [Variibacter sp.]|nr:hypothetical protein [Variibacter sp.]
MAGSTSRRRAEGKLAAGALRTTAEHIIDRLVAHGIDTLFCLPGVQNDPFFIALFEAAEKIKAIHTRHEQGAAYMALGAAMATGKPAVYCVVPGPGFLNTTAALATAYGNNAPVLALVGQVPQAYVNRDTGFLHDIPDQLGIMQRLTQFAARVNGPHEAPSLVDRAFHEMLSGRPRPAALEVPLDVWGRTGSAAPAGAIAAPLMPFPTDASLDAAANLLAAAERPLIVVGGGAQGASAEVTALAERIGAPVTAYRMGHGVVDTRHPLHLVLPAAHTLWPRADVAIGIGTRFHNQFVGWGVDDTLKTVRIDADPAEIVRHRPPTVALNGDAAAVARALVERLGKGKPRNAAWADEIAHARTGMAAQTGRLAPQKALIEALRAELPEEAVIVEELTQIGYASRILLPIHRPRTYLATGYQGTLGMGLPTALGAKVARPDVPVVSLSGDGGFLFNGSELATAAQFNIGVIAIVFNDNAYGNVRRMQKDDYGNRLIASDLRNPDFVKLAESHGIKAVRARSPEALRAALRQALAAPGPVLIEVPVGEMPNPWPFFQLPRNRPPKAG